MESHKMEKRSVHFRPTGLYPPRLWALCFCFFWVNMLETQIIVSADHFYLLHVPSWETRPFPFLKGSASAPPHGPPLSTETDWTMDEHIASAAPVTFYVFSFLNWGMKKQYQLTSVAKTVGLCRAGGWPGYHLGPRIPTSDQRELVSQAHRTPNGYTIPGPSLLSPSHTSYSRIHRISLVLWLKFPCTQAQSSWLPLLATQWASNIVKRPQNWLLSILILNTSGENANVRDL